MAAYPDLYIAYQSDPEPIGSIVIDRSEDGTGRGRAISADKMQFSLLHEFLTAAQKTTLSAFYTANRLIPFDYTSASDGVTYSCIFSGAIKYERQPGDYWHATVLMEEV